MIRSSCAPFCFPSPIAVCHNWLHSSRSPSCRDFSQLLTGLRSHSFCRGWSQQHCSALRFPLMTHHGLLYRRRLRVSPSWCFDQKHVIQWEILYSLKIGSLKFRSYHFPSSAPGCIMVVLQLRDAKNDVLKSDRGHACSEHNGPLWMFDGIYLT